MNAHCPRCDHYFYLPPFPMPVECPACGLELRFDADGRLMDNPKVVGLDGMLATEVLSAPWLQDCLSDRERKVVNAWLKLHNDRRAKAAA